MTTERRRAWSLGVPHALISPRMGVASACAAIVAIVTACDVFSTEVPSCYPAIPAANRFASDPAFADLRYRKRTEFDMMRRGAHEVWGDARFDYRSALDFGLMPLPGQPGYDRTCAASVALRVALPLDDGRKRQLESFIAVVAESAKIDRASLATRVTQRINDQEKYRPLLAEGGTSVQAGVIDHPNRGSFYQLSLEWQTPGARPSVPLAPETSSPPAAARQ